MSYKFEESAEFIALFNGKYTCAKPSISIKTLKSHQVIHTNNSETKMDKYSLSHKQLLGAINNSRKVRREETILCATNCVFGGHLHEINIRMVKKNTKYVVIDIYIN